MTRLYLLCGLPASGKSSLCRLRQGRIITADTIRLGVVGNLGDSKHDEFVWEIALKATEYFLPQQDVYYDATNSSKKRRAPFIRLAKEMGKEVVCLWVATPKKSCLQQNAQRGNNLPAWVIENVANSFEEPSFNEGFTWIERWITTPGGFIGQHIYPNQITRK